MDKVAEFALKIRKDLTSGRYAIGDKFYTDAELVERYGVSRTVVREAVSSLVHAGMIKRSRRVGTIVKSLKEVQKGSGNIAALVPCVRGGMGSHSIIIRGIEDAVAERGYNMILCNHDNNYEKACRYIDQLAEQGIAGVIIDPLECSEPVVVNKRIFERLESMNIQFVCVDKMIVGQEFGRVNFVGANGFYAIKKLVDYLYLELGHERIAFMGCAECYTLSQRQAGYIEGMRINGLRLRDDYIPQNRFGDDKPERKAITKLMELSEPPTAVICVHDFIAKSVIECLVEMGLSVPGDVSITGFDDLPFAEYICPPLTTIRQPMEEIGRQAVELLNKSLNNEINGRRQEFLDCELVLRESCSPCK